MLSSVLFTTVVPAAAAATHNENARTAEITVHDNVFFLNSIILSSLSFNNCHPSFRVTEMPGFFNFFLLSAICRSVLPYSFLSLLLRFLIIASSHDNSQSLLVSCITKYINGLNQCMQAVNCTSHL